MDLTLPLLGGLALLALIDSTSIGTLVVPVWLLTSGQAIRPRRMLVYLGTVAVFYLTVGVLLLLGFEALRDAAAGLADQEWLRALQLLVGVAMLAWAIFTRPRSRGSGRPGRLRRWRERATSDGPLLGLVTLALLVTTIELAMMLPYLAAITTLTLSDAGLAQRVLALLAYCLVMIAPGALLTVGRRLARRRVDPILGRLDRWTSRNAAELTGWVVGVAGFYLAANAAQALDVL